MRTGQGILISGFALIGLVGVALAFLIFIRIKEVYFTLSLNTSFLQTHQISTETTGDLNWLKIGFIIVTFIAIFGITKAIGAYADLKGYNSKATPKFEPWQIIS
jgi:hypothetical protein